MVQSVETLGGKSFDFWLAVLSEVINGFLRLSANDLTPRLAVKSHQAVEVAAIVIVGKASEKPRTLGMTNVAVGLPNMGATSTYSPPS